MNKTSSSSAASQATGGIRISEAMGLKWEDVDYQNKQIDLRRVWVKDTMMRALQPGS